MTEALRIKELERRLALVERQLAGLSLSERTMLRDQPLAQLIADAAYETGISAAKLVGDDRTAGTSRIRIAIYWVAREGLGYAYNRIGSRIGDRDHTTVISGCRRAEEMRRCDPAFRMLTDRLLKAAQERKQP